MDHFPHLQDPDRAMPCSLSLSAAASRRRCTLPACSKSVLAPTYRLPCCKPQPSRRRRARRARPDRQRVWLAWVPSSSSSSSSSVQLQCRTGEPSERRRQAQSRRRRQPPPCRPPPQSSPPAVAVLTLQQNFLASGPAPLLARPRRS